MKEPTELQTTTEAGGSAKHVTNNQQKMTTARAELHSNTLHTLTVA